MTTPLRSFPIPSWLSSKAKRHGPAVHRLLPPPAPLVLKPRFPFSQQIQDDSLDSVITNSAGIKKIAKPVENNIPVIVTVPMSRRAIAPAPSALQSGKSLRRKGKEVIRMGRSRVRAPLSAASMTDSLMTIKRQHTEPMPGLDWIVGLVGSVAIAALLWAMVALA